MIKTHCAGSVPATLLLCAAALFTAAEPAALQAQVERGGHQGPLFLTATNASPNFLVVINTRTKAVNSVPTGGAGGASGNAGGVAVSGRLAAAVNYGSSNVTIFVRRGNSMQAAEMITTAGKPVSVSFGHDHLFVLEATTAESFPIYGNMVSQTSDGSVPLLRGDGTAGQIVSFDSGVAYSETSGGIGIINFGIPGLIGPGTPVTLTAPNTDTPLGMVARGANVYATIAHSDAEVLINDGKIISTAIGPTPFKDSTGNLTHAPCWNALYGQFLYSSDSPGKQLLRYLVSDNNVFFDKAAVAQLAGAPTDLDIQQNMLAVIDGGDGTNANASVFEIDSEGELTLRFSAKVPGRLNGAALME